MRGEIRHIILELEVTMVCGVLLPEKDQQSWRCGNDWYKDNHIMKDKSSFAVMLSLKA
jgi:hypothetical protein